MKFCTAKRVLEMPRGQRYMKAAHNDKHYYVIVLNRARTFAIKRR